MTRKREVHPWDYFTLRKTNDGWDFSINVPRNGMILQLEHHAKTFDEAVALLKEHFEVS